MLTSEFSYFLQARRDTFNELLRRRRGRIARPCGEDTDTGSVEGGGEFDETARVRQLLSPFGGRGFSHAGGTADTGNPQVAGANFALGLRYARRRKHGVRRQIEVAFESAQFDGGEVMGSSVFENFVPGPCRAAERGEGYRQALFSGERRNCGSSSRQRQGLGKVAARELHGQYCPPRAEKLLYPILLSRR